MFRSMNLPLLHMDPNIVDAWDRQILEVSLEGLVAFPNYPPLADRNHREPNHQVLWVDSNSFYIFL